MKPSQWQPADPDFAAKTRASFQKQSFMQTLGAECTAVEPGYTLLTLPNQKHIHQHHGFIHGGVIGTLADNAAGFAAISLLPVGQEVLTVEYKINFMKPGDGEKLLTEGRVIRLGKALVVCQAEVFVDEITPKRLIASMQATMMRVPIE